MYQKHKYFDDLIFKVYTGCPGKMSLSEIGAVPFLKGHLFWDTCLVLLFIIKYLKAKFQQFGILCMFLNLPDVEKLYFDDDSVDTIDKNLHRDNKLSTIIKFKDICGHKRPIRNNSFLQ